MEPPCVARKLDELQLTVKFIFGHEYSEDP